MQGVTHIISLSSCVNVGMIGQQNGNRQFPRKSCVVQRRFPLADEFRSSLGSPYQRLDSTDFLGSVSSRTALLARICRHRDGCLQRPNILAAQSNDVGLIGKVAEDALILENGVVGLAEFAIALAETEGGRGREFALALKLFDDGLVGFDGGVEVVIGLFFKEALCKVSVTRSAHGRTLVRPEPSDPSPQIQLGEGVKSPEYSARPVERAAQNPV